MELILITALVIGAAMAIMAVGVLFGNRCLGGSCGGPEVIGPDGESLSCATCPRRGRQEVDEEASVRSAA
jgi:hypothetical protein